MEKCRDCGHDVSDQAMACPGCGAPFPARAKWDGWGYEYKSGMTFLGIPLIHISFKYRPNHVPVPARGIIAIGQFAVGFFTLSQFGIGIVSVSQFTVAVVAVAQFAAAYSLVAQMGFYIHSGYGQVVRSVFELWPK